MTFFTDCIPCQYGMHEHHRMTIQVAPEGGFGGAECPCTGDCATRNTPRTDDVDLSDLRVRIKEALT